MPRNGRLEHAVGRRPTVLMAPDITYRLASTQAQIRKLDADLRRLRAAIEQPHCGRTVLERPPPDFRPAVVRQSVRSLPHRVLIDGEDLAVAEQIDREGIGP